MPRHLSSPAFQELPPAVLTTVNDYTAKHPNFLLPDNFPRLVGLVARVKDSLVGPAKKGMFFCLSLLSCLIFFFLVAISAVNLRPEKIKKSKAAVSLFLIAFISSVLTFAVTQGKRPRLSKETVDSDDDIAEFLEDSVTPCDDCEPGHSFKACPKTPAPNVETVCLLWFLFSFLSVSSLSFTGSKCLHIRCPYGHRRR